MSRIVIFGASSGGATALGCLKDICSVVAFVDNDPGKQGTLFEGLPVVGPAQLWTMEFDLVVIASRYAAEIQAQLLSSGIRPERVYAFPLDALVVSLDEDYRRIESELADLRNEAFERVVVFGTGSRAKAAWDHISARFEIVCFADNDTRKQGGVFLGHRVIAPGTIPQQSFDRVIVASIYTREILAQLKDLGIPRDRIQCF